MVTNKTYGHPLGYTKTGKKAHLLRADNRPFCTSTGVAVRFLDDSQGVNYDQFCQECLQKRNKKALGAAYTQMQRELNQQLQQNTWTRHTQQSGMLRKLR